MSIAEEMKKHTTGELFELLRSVLETATHPDIEGEPILVELERRTTAMLNLIDEAAAPRGNCSACDTPGTRHPHFSMKIWVQKAREYVKY